MRLFNFDDYSLPVEVVHDYSVRYSVLLVDTVPHAITLKQSVIIVDNDAPDDELVPDPRGDILSRLVHIDINMAEPKAFVRDGRAGIVREYPWQDGDVRELQTLVQKVFNNVSGSVGVFAAIGRLLMMSSKELCSSLYAPN